MKLKLFFLGMVAAALMISCNNEIDEGRTPDKGGVVPSTGKVSYFAFKLPGSSSVNTRAGEGGDAGFPWENAVDGIYGDVAVFVYEWNGTTATAEAYAYMPDSYSSGTPVTLKVTDGTKKIYVALNVGEPGNTLLGASLNAAATAPPDDGEPWGTTFTALNQVIWTTFPTAPPFWDTTAPAVTAGTPPAVKVDNLLLGLTGSQFDGATPSGAGLIRFTDPAGVTMYSDAFLVMSNWDNNRIDSAEQGPSYESTCIFTLTPNVPLQDAIDGLDNSFPITVQRAVARASFNISAQNPTVAETWRYLSDPDVANSLSVGIFTPWNATSGTARGSWALGNINNETTVFQRFVSASGAVMDSKTARVVMPSSAWYQHYDNTRYFGERMLYPNMQVYQADSVIHVTGNSSGISTLNFQYLTENAQPYHQPAYQDNTTYIVLGGKYDPKQWVREVFRAQVPSPYDPGYLYFNDYSGSGNASGGTYFGTDFDPVPFPGTLGTAGHVASDDDTLYYYTPDEIFIYGKENVLKYFAWYALVIPDGHLMVSPQDSLSVIQYFNQEATPVSGIPNPNLVAYWGGQCLYRVWLRNPNLLSPPPGDLPNEEFLVRRNHIYNVNVSRITGPGIADPNRILEPGENVGSSPTYMAVEITIQQWHRIEDEVAIGPQ